VESLIAKFHRENPESAQVIEINSCDEEGKPTMPYSSPYNHATSKLGAAIIASFFKNAPRVLAVGPRLETPVIC
jgi:hypothetical protein